MNRKIIVIGSPGSGKSTFARKLHAKTGIPLFHLDLLYHRPDRTVVSREAFDAKLRILMAQSEWIIDGNYLRTLPVRLMHCNEVFLFCLPVECCLEGARARLGRSRPATLLRSLLQVGFAAGYVVMTGASPSLVRAFLFILLNELARLLPGRRRSPLNLFCTALTLQLALSPGVITSLGFQLSYLAMLGIVLVFPRLDAWYPRGPRLDPLRRIWSGVALTLSCQLFTAPLVWLRFRQFPKYFLLTNLGAMPLTEAFIACSLAVLAAGRRCPEGIKNLADAVGQILMHFLETIASIP